jgi:hypothetical protein
MTGRHLYAALHLLDRQLVDRDGVLCGKVDDLELTETTEGTVYVSALVSGPGALWYRLRHRRIGRWWRDHIGVLMGTPEPDPDRIPVRQVSDIGSAVTVSIESETLPSMAAERWLRDHLIGHIPGSRDGADQ